MNITVLVSCIFLIREKRDACSLKKLFTMEKKKDDNQYKFGLNPGTIYLLRFIYTLTCFSLGALE